MTLRFVAFDDTVRVREEAKGFDSFVFFGDRTTDGPGPQMYMNRVDPGVELAAHFHRVDQFQVFFGTPGSVFQRRPVPPLFVHYTDAYSTYGPFNSAADEPLLYATIRAESSNFGGVMPGARTLRPYRGARQLSSAVDGWTEESLPAAGKTVRQAVFEPEADGLGAQFVALGAGARVTLDCATPVSGRALCVVSGSIVQDDREFGARSLGWTGPYADPIDLRAGGHGAAVLVLDFPSPATQHARLTELSGAAG